MDIVGDVGHGVDLFLNIETIKGEAQDSKHKGEMDLTQWKWGAVNAGSSHVASGGGSGKVQVQDMSVTKQVDLASPSLMLACCSGKHFPTATLTVRKAGGPQQLEYYVITMYDVVVSSWTSGVGDVKEIQSEQVSLNFARFKIDYKVQDSRGQVGIGNEIIWDIAGNTGKSS